MVELDIHVSNFEPLTALEQLGVALTGDHTQRHIGIIYRSLEDHSLHLLHLAWHHRLRNERPIEPCIWLCTGLDSTSAMLLAGYCGMVSRKNRDGRIPYGIGYVPDNFEPTTGAWRLGEEGEGLTCATFVMSLFESYGFPIVVRTGWPMRPEDLEWQEQILQILEKRASPGHLEHQRQHLGRAVRFRPEEVAAAAGSADAPLDHQKATSRGRRTLEVLLRDTKRDVPNAQ